MKRDALGLSWPLPSDLVFLNHGSFGLAPQPLLQWRFALLEQMERDPVAFLADELPPGPRRLGPRGPGGAAPSLWPERLAGLQRRHHQLALQGQQVLVQALKQRGFQVPVIPLQPHQQGAQQFLRISCFAYNDASDVERLAAALLPLLSS